MPRRARVTPGGLVYHVLNRSVAGLPLFRKEADYAALERIMGGRNGDAASIDNLGRLVLGYASCHDEHERLPVEWCTTS